MIGPSNEGLTIGDCPAAALAERFGTPLFVYDAALIKQAYERVRNAVEYRPFRIHYAAVCNPNVSILRVLREVGAGLHANTPGDVYCGLRAGFSPNTIEFSGSNLGDDDLAYLFGTGVHVNLDSADDLDRACRLGKGRSFGLRVHLGGLLPESRMGLREGEVRDAEAAARRADCRIDALHVYCGTHGRAMERWGGAASLLATMAEDLPDVACLNIGGGFGYDYDDPETGAFRFDAIGQSATTALTRLAERTGRHLMLRLEPGRTIVAGAGILLTRVRSVKREPHFRYVGVDTTVANFTSPAVHGARRRVVCVETQLDIEGPAHVCGSTTYSRDFIARDVTLPNVSVGDLLAVLDTGAYGYCMASHFLNRPRPAEVLVDHGDVRLITRRESFEDLVAAQLC